MTALADELERLAKEATPGEWRVFDSGLSNDRVGIEAEDVGVSIVVYGDADLNDDCGVYGRDSAEGAANAALIVALRNALPAILSVLRGEEWEGIETHDGSNHPVLIYGNGIVGAARFREYMYRREWWWVGEGPGDAFAEPVRNPTHWMPFPPSPKGTTHE